MARKAAAGKKISKSRTLPVRRQPRKIDLQPASIIPGEIILGQGDIIAFEGRQTLDVTVANIGDRPIQVGSHCHL